MKNSMTHSLTDNRIFLWATLPFIAILMLVFLGTSVDAFGENTFNIIYKANLLEDNWDRKAQGMIKIVSIEDEKQILIVENFVTTSDHILDVHIAPGNDLKKRIQLGEINPNSKTHFYFIPKEVNFLEYNTILVTEKQYFAIYGKATIF